MFRQIKILIKALRILNSIILRMLYSKMDILIRLIQRLIPAECISLQIKINFRSPYVYYDRNTYFVYPDGDISDSVSGVDSDSYGRNSYFALRGSVAITSRVL